VVKAEDSQLSSCGFKSRHRILLQLKIKVAKWGTPKKKKKRMIKSLNSFIWQKFEKVLLVVA
jgi:hypothetical protein